MAFSPPSKSNRDSLTLKAVTTAQVSLSQSFQHFKCRDRQDASQGLTPFSRLDLIQQQRITKKWPSFRKQILGGI
jgi:hypothetical protein